MNVTIYKLQVLANADLQQISERLRQPSSELVNSVTGEPSEQTIENIRDLVAFDETEAFDDEGIREFSNSSKHGGGVILDRVADVSRQFPHAVFLLEQFDDQLNYESKVVIHSGEVTHRFTDHYQRAQALSWVLPDIFTPFKVEHTHKLRFGSLWQEWLEDMGTAIEVLNHQANQKTAEADRLMDGLLAQHAAFQSAQLRELIDNDARPGA